MTRRRRDYAIVIVFGFLWMAFGWYISLEPKRGEARLVAVAKWPAYPATVISSDAAAYASRSRKSGRRMRTYPRIVYRYEVDGVIRTNETRNPGYYVIGSRSHAENVVGHFPPGSKVRVRVNPANPWEAELEGAGAGPIFKRGRLVANILMGIGAFLIVGGIWEITKLSR